MFSDKLFLVFRVFFLFFIGIIVVALEGRVNAEFVIYVNLLQSLNEGFTFGFCDLVSMNHMPHLSHHFLDFLVSCALVLPCSLVQAFLNSTNTLNFAFFWEFLLLRGLHLGHDSLFYIFNLFLCVFYLLLLIHYFWFGRLLMVRLTFLLIIFDDKLRWMWI